MFNVLSVAYPLAPVGFDTPGGSEQILALLDSALVERGHRSIVVGCAGSSVRGILISTPWSRDFFQDSGRKRLHQLYRAAIRTALDKYEIDVIHLHGIDADRYIPPPGPAALITLHLPPAWYAPQVFSLDRPQTYLNCVSRSQQNSCPDASYLLPAIENGVPVDRFPLRARKRRFALVLARVCPQKGIHIALDAAAHACLPVLVGGEVFPYEDHETYFREEVAPRLGSTSRFLGPLGFSRKRRLLSAARCLLVPSLVPETSSLVAMEALACGTPVIAFGAGALGEIVEDGVTGFLVSDGREMAEAIRAVRNIDPLRCRRAAVERFSAERMVSRYIELYDALCGGGHRPPLTD
jgi:glycosyltransferase involved in cell wall biosynthesis